MASYGVPKFKAFTKTKVVLSLEKTPLPIEQNTDLTALVPTQFRDGAGTAVAAAEAAEELAAGPEMFKKKRDKKVATGKPRAVAQGAEASGFIGLVSRKKTGAPGPKKAYLRANAMSREQQQAEVIKLGPELQDKAKVLLDIETADPYQIESTDVFVPMTRRGFGSFLENKFGPIFPKAGQKALDVATCAAKGQEGVKEVKIYHYQAFIREYLRFESPYRGLLVYHGLGSGKTCSAIAAAEALFGTRGLKIVVMTPFSLRDNFISEINFCGFKHFRLQNHWTSLSLKPGSNPEPAMVRMFAQNVFGVPDSFFAKRAKGRAQLERIWVPDFEQAPNFDALSPIEKDEIKTQLKATIEHRITFINYNGISARDLKTMVCSTPEIFDNSVIVVDEIHNLIRLMQGCLEPYFSNPPGRRRTLPLEVLTPDRKKLPLCGMTKNYMRGYLFYRLFMDAKNSKIIGLSGTPLINFPEELGILANILHGAIHKLDFRVQVEGGREVKPFIDDIAKNHPDIDTVHYTVSDGSIEVTMTRLPEHFTKVMAEDGEIMGIERRDPGKPIPTLDQVWESLAVELKAQGIKVIGKAMPSAQELLPSWDTPFRGAFLQEDGVTLKNVAVLQKRIRGLVSYYRGIQGDVMPKVIKDEIVGVPLTGYSLKIYNKLRNQEIQIEMKKPKDKGTAGDAVWAEVTEIAGMKSASNYRMSSRQACNFAFPEGVSRPRPHNLEEADAETGTDRDVIIDADVEDRAPGKDEEDKEAGDDDETKAEALQEVGKKAEVVQLGTKEAKNAYIAALKSAKDKLRSMGKTHLMLDGPPENNLQKFSPKFAAMLKNINGLNGSSLVYSNFLEMEGIGIFAICMEANGYDPIQITPELKFTERTIASLAKGPGVPQKRYIEFTGVGSKEQRGAAVDVFNARLDKLPPTLQKVLQDAKWENNFDGGLCRAFCITSAGAEGLSLKCVRGVHIMEPYWNTVRTQQVKGRAVRICSHVDLPKEEQNVEIYTYCTIIPEQAILAQAIDKTLEHSDSYSARDAAALGVPVPAIANADEELPEGMFLKVAALPGLGSEDGDGESQGETMSTDGPIRFSSKLANEYHGFSTFAKSPVNVGGKIYPTLEHYFQSMKFPSDLEWQEAIRVSLTPAKAKQLGAQTDHQMDPSWDSKKESVMLTGLRAKFQQNSGLLEQLKATGERALIESSTDAYWGEGRTGKGKNRYGKLLEQVRLELKEYVIEGSATAPVIVETGEDFFEEADVGEEEGLGEAISEATSEATGAPQATAAPAASVTAPVAPTKRVITIKKPTSGVAAPLAAAAAVAPLAAAPLAAAPLVTKPGKSEENIYKAEVENADKFFKGPGGMENQYAANWDRIQKEALEGPAKRQAIVDESRRLAEERGMPVAAPVAEPVAAPVAEETEAENEDEDEDENQTDSENQEDGLGLGKLQEQKGGGPDDDRVIILTSDQKVLLISLRKEKVISSLQTLMKSVAVDCKLNYQDNNDGTFRCMALGDSIGDFAYHPNLQKDIQETEARFRVQPTQLAGPPVDLASVAAQAQANTIQVEAPVPVVKPKKIMYRKKEYYYTIPMGADGKPQGYVFYSMEDPGLTSPIGFVKADPAKKYYPTGDIGPVPEGVV